MEYKMPKMKFDEKLWDRFQASVRDAINKHDFDSGWVKTPTDKIFRHNLTVVPRTINVQSSDNANGDEADSDSYTGLNRKQVTIGGPKAFARVFANK